MSNQISSRTSGKFPWGKVLDRIPVNLDDDRPVEVIKYEAYKGNPEDGTVVRYHVGREPGSYSGNGFSSMEAAIIHIIAQKHAGGEVSYELTHGIARALQVPVVVD